MKLEVDEANIAGNLEVSLPDVEARDERTKSISLFSAACFAIGVTVGSGIFVSVSESYNVFRSQNILIVAVFWIVTGLISLIGGLCYAELATRIPESGGERTYYRKILRPEFSTTFVIMYVAGVKILTMSGLAIATGSYMSSIIGIDNKLIEKTIAVTTLSICHIVNCYSKQVVLKLGNAFTTIKVVAMMMIIITGMVYLAKSGIKQYNYVIEFKKFNLNALIDCFLNLLWTNEGLNMVGFIAGDVQRPSKNLPRAIAISGTLVTVLYTLTAISYSFVIGYEETRIGKNVATLLSIKAMGPVYFILPSLVCCSAAGAVLGTFYAVSSACVSSAYQSEIPSMFSLVDRKERTAVLTNMMVYTGTLLFVPFKFKTLVKYTCVLSWMFYTLSYVALLKVKISTRKEKIPGIFQINYVFVVFMILVSASVVLGCFATEPIASTVFTLVTITIFLIQFIPDKFWPTNAVGRIQAKIIDYMGKYFNLVLADKSDIS